MLSSQFKTFSDRNAPMIINIAFIKGHRCANASLSIIQMIHLDRSVLESSGDGMKSKIFPPFFFENVNNQMTQRDLSVVISVDVGCWSLHICPRLTD